ncbi:hypothetical protein ACK2FM_02290 [Clostridioides difficile]
MISKKDEIIDEKDIENFRYIEEDKKSIKVSKKVLKKVKRRKKQRKVVLIRLHKNKAKKLKVSLKLKVNQPIKKM